MVRKILPPIFPIIITPICLALYFYALYSIFFVNSEAESSRYFVNWFVDFGFSVSASLLLIIEYIWYVNAYLKKKKGYVREKVYITHCPHCGYEFKYGVGKYCPQCHRRIWRPYKWVWVKKEEGEGENLKISGGDR